MVKFVGWNVYLDNRLIDTVYFTEDCDRIYVLNSLIMHDGYDPGITVRMKP